MNTAMRNCDVPEGRPVLMMNFVQLFIIIRISTSDSQGLDPEPKAS